MMAWPFSWIFGTPDKLDVDVTWKGAALILLIHALVISVAFFLL